MALIEILAWPLHCIVSVDGIGSYGIQKRYYRRSTGEVLYDVLEFGSKHRDSSMHGVAHERITPRFNAVAETITVRTA